MRRCSKYSSSWRRASVAGRGDAQDARPERVRDPLQLELRRVRDPAEAAVGRGDEQLPDRRVVELVRDVEQPLGGGGLAEAAVEIGGDGAHRLSFFRRRRTPDDVGLPRRVRGRPERGGDLVVAEVVAVAQEDGGPLGRGQVGGQAAELLDAAAARRRTRGRGRRRRRSGACGATRPRRRGSRSSAPSRAGCPRAAATRRPGARAGTSPGTRPPRPACRAGAAGAAARARGARRRSSRRAGVPSRPSSVLTRGAAAV